MLNNEEILMRRLLGARLLLLREERGLTLQEVSDYADVPVSTIHQYENAKREAKFIAIAKLTQFFDVTADWLIGRSDVRK